MPVSWNAHTSKGRRTYSQENRSNRLKVLYPLKDLRLLMLIFLSGSFVGCQTTQFRDGGEVKLGGETQVYRARGAQNDLPVLLFLHGGPGVPEMPLANVTKGLEEEFIVVHWDQRGTGKSYRSSDLPEVMTVDQFIADAVELTDFLRRRYQREKIHLVGFSFGSLVGINAVSQFPEKYESFTSIAQFVNLAASEGALLAEGKAYAKSKGDSKGVEELGMFGSPLDDTRAQAGEINKLLAAQHKAKIPNRFGVVDYLLEATFGGVYTPIEVTKAIRGRKFSGDSLEEELYKIDLRKKIQTLDVPTTFLLGRWDTLLSSTVANDYISSLSTPEGRRVVWFEKSGHPMHLEQPLKFVEVMREVKASTSAR